MRLYDFRIKDDTKKTSVKKITDTKGKKRGRPKSKQPLDIHYIIYKALMIFCIFWHSFLFVFFNFYLGYKMGTLNKFRGTRFTMLARIIDFCDHIDKMLGTIDKHQLTHDLNEATSKLEKLKNPKTKKQEALSSLLYKKIEPLQKQMDKIDNKLNNINTNANTNTTDTIKEIKESIIKEIKESINQTNIPNTSSVPPMHSNTPAPPNIIYPPLYPPQPVKEDANHYIIITILIVIIMIFFMFIIFLSFFWNNLKTNFIKKEKH
ncbi:hypothetical protein [Candidatus Phytoplasma meliae]|uniref:Uncharacterized protein n=1 Tax=Candidatus Phytoplasma meliae TaxID=1848402 RepID=A0ABS5CXD8_9MOLU|nr:hypothetical protein [Candidatus Phytoplasma meliae]MBP5835645.1 hypothetical protein [Candidatus Phytoplasma meliae]